MAEVLLTVDAVVEKYCVSNNKMKSIIYQSLGLLFTIFALIGIFVPGWPTVSWAVPATFLFSLSNEKLFRWSLTNKFFGSKIFDYYSTGKTLPKHVKIIIMGMVGIMTLISTYFVWFVSTKGDGTLMEPSSWTGADEYGLGSLTIAFVGLLGILYIWLFVKTRVNTSSTN
tara:strand:+ start:180 stop:689 length:510 start_codon:yes stop_codon:yes gene_type:complete